MSINPKILYTQSMLKESLQLTLNNQFYLNLFITDMIDRFDLIFKTDEDFSMYIKSKIDDILKVERTHDGIYQISNFINILFSTIERYLNQYEQYKSNDNFFILFEGKTEDIERFLFNIYIDEPYDKRLNIASQLMFKFINVPEKSRLEFIEEMVTLTNLLYINEKEIPISLFLRLIKHEQTIKKQDIIILLNYYLKSIYLRKCEIDTIFSLNRFLSSGIDQRYVLPISIQLLLIREEIEYVIDNEYIMFSNQLIPLIYKEDFDRLDLNQIIGENSGYKVEFEEFLTRVLFGQNVPKNLTFNSLREIDNTLDITRVLNIMFF